MDKLNRILELNKILANRRTPISSAALQERLECSRATLNRIFQIMRDYLNAPITYDRQRNGYHYDRNGGQHFELPGLWLNASELHALLLIQNLMVNIQPGLLDQTLAPIRERIDQILRHKHTGHPDIDKRIRILPIAGRSVELEKFQQLAGALLDRQQVRILYHGRARDETTEREISPQRIIYYRSNWYLDAWCHTNKGLRSFSLDRLHVVIVYPEKPAQEISEEILQEHYADAYGIFAGKADKTAILRFSTGAAKWVADEQWHPAQAGTVLKSGEYELHIPYHNPTELIMDILKYGPDVEVMQPVSLRKQVAERLKQATGKYTNDPE
jgi:predicted DNA-binding transcriptional regulator YafY